MCLADVIASGGLPALVGLELHKNEMGDMGVEALAKALETGASKAVMYLGLSMNRVTDQGAVVVKRVVSSNALPKLERLNLQVSNGVEGFGLGLGWGTEGWTGHL